MSDQARFPAAGANGLYESYFLRAFSPREPVGIWIRNTVELPPGGEPSGTVWWVLFDGRDQSLHQGRAGSQPVSVPAGAWIQAGTDNRFAREGASGRCGEAAWELSFSDEAPAQAATQPLRHLAPELLYRLPLPRTKLTSPRPWALISGSFQLQEGPRIELERWPGMVGHNWGREHAEQWIWLHATGFEAQPQAWIDLALGRLRVGGRLTPWTAAGMVCAEGVGHRLGGLLRRPDEVRAREGSCAVRLGGADGLGAEIEVRAATSATAHWHYEDPAGGCGREVANCSIAAMALRLRLPGRSAPLELHSAHGAAYELGGRPALG